MGRPFDRPLESGAHKARGSTAFLVGKQLLSAIPPIS